MTISRSRSKPDQQGLPDSQIKSRNQADKQSSRLIRARGVLGPTEITTSKTMQAKQPTNPFPSLNPFSDNMYYDVLGS